MVVVGMGNDKKGNYFTVYDNASGAKQEGASPENKLYYDEEKNTISGRTNTGYSQGGEKDYTVSQVRETKELN